MLGHAATHICDAAADRCHADGTVSSQLVLPGLKCRAFFFLDTFFSLRTRLQTLFSEVLDICWEG